MQTSGTIAWDHVEKGEAAEVHHLPKPGAGGADCDRCYTPRTIARDYVEKGEAAAVHHLPKPGAGGVTVIDATHHVP